MLRRCLIAAASILALATPAAAQQIHALSGEAPRGIDGVNVRQLPGATLVIAPDDRDALVIPGAERYAPLPGAEIFLVELEHPSSDLQALEAVCRVLWNTERFALVQANAHEHRLLDVLGNHKERVTYFAPRAISQESRFVHEKAPLVDPQVKADIVGAVDQDRISTIIGELSGGLFFFLDGVQTTNDNRNTYDPGHHIAADYLEERFAAAGYTVVRQNFSVFGTPTQNIIAVKTGTVNPNEIVVVGAHYDSISEKPSVLAPGAEDNGSGTAAVLHVAEVFANYETDVTIHFVAFGGEEQGLYGSQHYVSEAIANGDDVTNALTMDMIATWQTNYEVIIEGEPEWETLMTVFESNVISEAQIGYRKDYYSWGSDHVPFQQAGIPAFLAIDMDYGSYAHYHRTTDTWDHLDMSLAWRITRAMAGAVADLTNPVSQPSAVPPVARALALDQNVPNPFNPRTTISFDVSSPGHVKLAVYDLAGRLVRTLHDGHHGGGPGQVEWDGRGVNASPVASGVYVYRLETERGQLTRRMVLAK
jgi:hypothetical protein